MTPQISIGLPVFNGEKYLAQAIESLLDQSYADFELIISDNASQDRTQEICHEFAQRDQRIRYIRQPANIGAPRNFNFAFKEARGKYFKWACDNDLCDPALLSRCKQCLDERPDVVLCYGKTMAIDAEGKFIEAVEDNLALDDPRPSRRFLHVVDRMVSNNVHAGLFRSDVLSKTRLEQPYPTGDLVLIAELALYGRFCELPDVLFYRRQAPGVSTKFRTMSEVERLCAPDSTIPQHWSMWRTSRDYVHAALRSPVGFSEKAFICSHILKRCYRGRRVLVGELLKKMRGEPKPAREPRVEVHP